MTVSSITICSNSLVLLGGNEISSFLDGDTGSTIAKLLYESTYHSMLTETNWHFAQRTERLAMLEEKPENGYKNKFKLPVDCLTVVKCDSKIYEIYERELYTNANEVLIEYVFPPTEVNLPPSFIKALEYNLAAQFAIPLTGNTSRAEFYAGVYQDAVKKARWVDAQARPNRPIADAPYIRARFE